LSDTDTPSGGIAIDQLNNFEYVNADGSGDPKGLCCPVGAHRRRVNPRGQPITGQRSAWRQQQHSSTDPPWPSLWPTFDPKQPYDGIKRGFLGYFINASIENQYEFVLGHCVNDSEFAGVVRLNPKSKNPMIGSQDPAENIFVIPQANGQPPIKVTGL
jgi:hypothetical protein